MRKPPNEPRHAHINDFVGGRSVVTARIQGIRKNTTIGASVKMPDRNLSSLERSNIRNIEQEASSFVFGVGV